MKHFSTYCTLLLLPLLAACESGSVANTFGLSRDAPDEFVVVSRPPLSLPPEFTLRPPEPGAAPLGTSADSKARALLTGKSATANADPATRQEPTAETAVTPVIRSEGLSSGATGLLKRAGADAADEAVRDKLRVDAVTPADTSKADTLLDKLTGAEKPEPMVDAKKEAERLRANKDAGKPLTEGEVPEAQPARKSLIDRLF